MCVHTHEQWLENEFLPYLDEWEKSVKERDGYDATQKKEDAPERANNAGATDDR